MLAQFLVQLLERRIDEGQGMIYIIHSEATCWHSKFIRLQCFYLMNFMWSTIDQLKCCAEHVLQLLQKFCFFLIVINYGFPIHISHDVHHPLLERITAPTLWGSSSVAWHGTTKGQDPWINWHSQMGLGYKMSSVQSQSALMLNLWTMFLQNDCAWSSHRKVILEI